MKECGVRLIGGFNVTSQSMVVFFNDLSKGVEKNLCFHSWTSYEFEQYALLMSIFIIIFSRIKFKQNKPLYLSSHICKKCMNTYLLGWFLNLWDFSVKCYKHSRFSFLSVLILHLFCHMVLEYSVLFWSVRVEMYICILRNLQSNLFHVCVTYFKWVWFCSQQYNTER